MDKNFKVRKVIYSNYNFNGDLNYIIDYLKDINNLYKEIYSSIKIESNYCNECGCGAYSIVGEREENEKEYNERTNREQKIKKETVERDVKQFEELKKKYGW